MRYHFSSIPSRPLENFLLTILIFGIISCLASCLGNVGPSLKTDVLIEYEHIEGCDHGFGECDTERVVRQSLKENINLIFPHGGTSTRLILYDKQSFQKMQQTVNASIKPLKVDYTNSNDAGKMPTINLKNLPDGLYCIHMIADAYGGFKWVIIETE